MRQLEVIAALSLVYANEHSRLGRPCLGQHVWGELSPCLHRVLRQLLFVVDILVFLLLVEAPRHRREDRKVVDVGAGALRLLIEHRDLGGRGAVCALARLRSSVVQLVEVVLVFLTQTTIIGVPART